MGTTGPFAACAGAKGTCDKCYPGSPCGAKPAGWTAPPTTPPTARPIQWREAPSPANRTACEEVENSKISYSTYGFLETCIAADRSGLCVHKQVADACPVHCGRCGGKPAAWGAPFASSELQSLPTEKSPLSVLCSNMCRPELTFSQRCREQGIWNSLEIYLQLRKTRWSMWCSSWQTVLPRHLRLVWCVPALSGRMLTAAAIFVVLQKSLMMKVPSLSLHGSVCPTASRARRPVFVDATLIRPRIARKQCRSFH